MSEPIITDEQDPSASSLEARLGGTISVLSENVEKLLHWLFLQARKAIGKTITNPEK